jgi:predicted nucleotidyltransferase
MKNKLKPIVFCIDDEEVAVIDFAESAEKDRLNLFFQDNNFKQVQRKEKRPVSIVNISNPAENNLAYAKSGYEERFGFLTVTRTQMNINDTFYLKFIKLLNKYEVEYLLIGGLAVAFHGYSRVTHDMDLWSNPHPDNAKKLLKAIDEFGYDIDVLKGVYLGNNEAIKLPFEQNSSLRKIEILANVTGLFDFAQSYLNRVETDFEGVKMNFISYNDLVEAKAATHRPKDIDDIRELVKIKAEIER